MRIGTTGRAPRRAGGGDGYFRVPLRIERDGAIVGETRDGHTLRLALHVRDGRQAMHVSLARGPGA